MDNDHQPLFTSFQDYFSISLANTPALQEEIYQIRYRVYCEEFAYLPSENYPNQRETDEFDTASWHCLITHKTSGASAACVRLVSPATTSGGILLPFEKYCGKNLDTEFLNSLNLDRQNVCEISRVAIERVFRRRSGEIASRFGDVLDFSDLEKRTCSLITVAAFFAAIALTELTGRTNVFALMEPFLAKLLRHHDILFQRVGNDADYHGIRAPYVITTQAVLDHINPEMTVFYRWVKQQIEIAYPASEVSIHAPAVPR